MYYPHWLLAVSWASAPQISGCPPSFSSCEFAIASQGLVILPGITYCLFGVAPFLVSLGPSLFAFESCIQGNKIVVLFSGLPSLTFQEFAVLLLHVMHQVLAARDSVTIKLRTKKVGMGFKFIDGGGLIGSKQVDVEVELRVLVPNGL